VNLVGVDVELIAMPLANAYVGAVAVGAMVSSVMVSLAMADQLPPQSRHLTRTVFTPLVADTVTCCSGQ
jgi:hypothetical protein